MPTPVCTIDETGIHAPTYADCLDYLNSAYRDIYGADVNLDPDTQDGQLLAIFALVIHDSNSMAVAAYNSFSPATAQGVGLSSVVKINGIARSIASNSQVDVTIVGVAGTSIISGFVGATNSANRWALPYIVIIPDGGSVNVTATCDTPGAITATAGEINKILTPTAGWQSVTNLTAASLGEPVETDALLRIRQATSTALPSRTVLDGVIGAIAALTGVTRYLAHENDTNITDVNGVPSHTLSMVVEGGDTTAILSAIADKKAPGTGTFGTTSGLVLDNYGIPRRINFFRPTVIPLSATISITIVGFTGYTSSIGQELVAAVVAYINALPIGGIGGFVRRIQMFVPAQLAGPYAKPVSLTDASTYQVLDILIGFRGGAVGTADLPLAFNEAASLNAADVTLAVTS